jgi:hypothetical protein
VQRWLAITGTQSGRIRGPDRFRQLAYRRCRKRRSDAVRRSAGGPEQIIAAAGWPDTDVASSAAAASGFYPTAAEVGQTVSCAIQRHTSLRASPWRRLEAKQSPRGAAPSLNPTLTRCWPDVGGNWLIQGPPGEDSRPTAGPRRFSNGRTSVTSGIRAKGKHRIEFDFEFQGKHYRPTLRRCVLRAVRPRGQRDWFGVEFPPRSAQQKNTRADTLCPSFQTVRTWPV